MTIDKDVVARVASVLNLNLNALAVSLDHGHGDDAAHEVAERIVEALAHSTEQTDDAVVERVARAICAANGEDPDYQDMEPDGPREWMKYKVDARAAIAAMPTGQTNRVDEAVEAEHLRRVLRCVRPYISDKAGAGILGAVDDALAAKLESRQ